MNRIINKLIILFILLIYVSSGLPQNTDSTATDTLTIDDYYIDFAIPDLSAFALLGVNPNKVARPGNIKELAIAATDFIDTDGNLKPGLAIEWSPFFTLGSKSIKDYRDNYLLRNLQLSFATVKDTTATNMGVGIRWVPIDKSDILTSEDYDAKMIKILTQFDLRPANAERVNEFTTKVNEFFMPLQDDPVLRFKLLELLSYKEDDKRSFEKIMDDLEKEISIQNLPLTPDQRSTLKELAREYHSLLDPTEYLKEIERQIKEIKKEFNQSKWNKNVLHVAVGFVGGAENSQWKKLELGTFTGFTGYTLPVTASSQFILQVLYRTDLKDDPDEEWYYSLGGRFLIGNSKNRFSAEYLYSNTKNKNEDIDGSFSRLTLAGEIKISQGTWFEVAWGTRFKGSISKASFDILGSFKYALQKERRFNIN